MRYASTVLFVEDIGPVLDFYRRAFGFEPRFRDDEYGFAELDAGGATIGIASHRCGAAMMPHAYPRPPGGAPCGVELAFHVEDVGAAFDRAIAAGATALAAPTRTPWGQVVAYVLGVEGTVIGLCTPLP